MESSSRELYDLAINIQRHGRKQSGSRVQRKPASRSSRRSKHAYSYCNINLVHQSCIISREGKTTPLYFGGISSISHSCRCW